MPRNGIAGSANRRQRILGLVNERGDVLVSDLKDVFGVFEVTVRSDPAMLARRGLVVRTHGAAASPASGLKAGAAERAGPGDHRRGRRPGHRG